MSQGRMFNEILAIFLRPVWLESWWLLFQLSLLSKFWLNSSDYPWHFLAGTPFLARIMAGGLLKPKNKLLGSDVAGRVEAVGANVKQFRPGDEVFGSSSHGCFAEYVCVSEKEVVTKPVSITFEAAAAAGAAAFAALQGLRDAGQIKPGQKVLINGASGGVGTLLCWLANLDH